jgi:hypothetical protein
MIPIKKGILFVPVLIPTLAKLDMEDIDFAEVMATGRSCHGEQG